MKYLIMIHSNPAFREIWEGLPEDQRMEFGRAHLALTEDLAAAGVLVSSEGLADPSLAKCVQVRDGHTMTTDGPFAEVKEHLVGFYVVECDNMEVALRYAARVPDAAYGPVEVRPVLDFKGWEM